MYLINTMSDTNALMNLHIRCLRNWLALYPALVYWYFGDLIFIELMKMGIWHYCDQWYCIPRNEMAEKLDISDCPHRRISIFGSSVSKKLYIRYWIDSINPFFFRTWWFNPRLAVCYYILYIWFIILSYIHKSCINRTMNSLSKIKCDGFTGQI